MLSETRETENYGWIEAVSYMKKQQNFTYKI